MNASINLLVTGLCSGGCEFCSVQPWMDCNYSYHMSLKEVDDFIYYSRLSNYKFKRIGIIGGEPLLWKHQREGLKVLYEANIAESIRITSNGLIINERNKELLDSILPYIHELKISKYIGNEKNIKFALKNLPKEKIKIVTQIDRFVTPTEFISNSLPADCGCRVFSVSKGRVDACSPVRTMGYLPPESNPITLKTEGFIILEDEADKYSTELRKNYLDHFKTMDRFSQPYCQACIANAKIHKKVRIVENQVGGG